MIIKWCSVKPGHVEVTPQSSGLMRRNDWSLGLWTVDVKLSMASALSTQQKTQGYRGSEGWLTLFSISKTNNVSRQWQQLRTRSVSKICSSFIHLLLRYNILVFTVWPFKTTTVQKCTLSKQNMLQFEHKVIIWLVLFTLFEQALTVKNLKEF